MPAALSKDAESVLGLIDNALKSCAWESWDMSSKKHREPITATQALKIKEHLAGPKLEEIFLKQQQTSAFVSSALTRP